MYLFNDRPNDVPMKFEHQVCFTLWKDIQKESNFISLGHRIRKLKFYRWSKMSFFQKSLLTWFNHFLAESKTIRHKKFFFITVHKRPPSIEVDPKKSENFFTQNGQQFRGFGAKWGSFVRKKFFFLQQNFKNFFVLQVCPNLKFRASSSSAALDDHEEYSLRS